MKYKATIDDDTGIISVTVPKSELERIAGETNKSYEERLQELANNIYLAVEEARTLHAMKKYLLNEVNQHDQHQKRMPA